MRTRTTVVDGPLARRMARLEAAESHADGLRILSMAELSSRLAGGFVRAAGPEDVEIAVAKALGEGGFRDIEAVRELPGMVRAVARTLADAWSAAIALDEAAPAPRIADLALVDLRVRKRHLPSGVLAPPELVEAALARLGHAPALIGPVTLLRVREPAAVWRRLLENLSDLVELEWRGHHPPGAWFRGRRRLDERVRRPPPRIVVCPDPRSEAVMALRWVRMLLSSGLAAPREIAIAAADPAEWDEHIMAMVAEADLPVHFSHGVPALATAEGQACASLADVLGEGLSQDRVRRVLARLQGEGGALVALPPDPLLGVPREASLRTLGHWARALETAATARTDGFDPRVLLPILSALAEGPAASERLGLEVLRGSARDHWAKALRRAPPRAMPYALDRLRASDGSDPGACVAFAPTSHLACAPRPFVWLLGLTAGGSPRAAMDDALLPRHLLGGRRLREPTVTECDRLDFASVAAGAAGALVLSRGARSAQGRVLAPSPLIPSGSDVEVVDRSHVPAHAYSEADRILARPAEAADIATVALALACTRGRRSSVLGAHDGMMRPDHPAIVRALTGIQSATSLVQLLRDPLGFAWRYALDWRSTLEEPLSLSLDDRTFGELVHEILHRTVSTFEPAPGLAAATPRDVEASLEAAAERIATDWPTTRPVPPPVLWRHAVGSAVVQARRALALDLVLRPGTRSWTEVKFGFPEATPQDVRSDPWDPAATVSVPGTDVRIRGTIDRLDLLAGDQAVRLSDYKTGEAPPDARGMRLRGGAELQRVVYAVAVLANLPKVDHLVSRLVHLADDPPVVLKLDGIGHAVDTLAAHLSAADALLRRGAVLPGPDASSQRNAFRVALPAACEGYFALKGDALADAFGDFAEVWSSP